MDGLPPHYQDDRLLALVRDPRTIFVYWELEGPASARARERLPEAERDEADWALRLTCLDTGATEVIGIDPSARNWYVGAEAGSTYEVELGLRHPASGFHRVLRCGPVRMPPEQYSSLYDRDWMVEEEEFLEILALAGAGPAGSSGLLLRKLLNREEDLAFATVTQEPSPSGNPGTRR
jgi:hypothetical protein